MPAFGILSSGDLEIPSPTVHIIFITIPTGCVIAVKTIRNEEMLSYWKWISLILRFGFTCMASPFYARMVAVY
jgi:hypothetical protein